MMQFRSRLPLALTAATLAVTALLTAGCAGEKKEGKAEAGKSTAGATGQPAAAPAAPVRVATAERETVTRYVRVTGNLAALQSVDLAPKLSARVVSVAGREGAAVRKGQVVVQQDPSDFRVQLDQAVANLQAARARLAQAEAVVKSSRVRLTQAKRQVELQEVATTAGVQDAQQQVKAAEAQLEIARRPQRTQEVEVAESQVALAQANYDKAQADRERYELLYKEGATPKATLDQYVNQERVSKAALDSAKKQLELAQIGGREESIRNAETALARAQWQLRLAKSNRDQVNVRQDDVRAAEAAVTQAEAEVRAARATVAQNQAAVANARLQLANTAIVSPIDGLISERLTEPGQIAAPGSPVLRVVALDTVFFEAQVPETELASISPSQEVEVGVDAYPGRKFPGKVARIYPTGSTASRTVVVRVEIANPNKTLRPGLFARGQVIAEQRQGVVVPTDALVTLDGQNYVFVAENGAQAVRREVRVGIETANTVEIRSGVAAGESVIVAGQGGLKDGAPIKVEGETRQTASL